MNKPLNTMEYDSPSGKINIGKFVPPFEQVKEGFGFRGMLAEDAESHQLQCHVCGVWVDSLSTHCRLHKMEGRDYKNKFELSKRTALRSTVLRVRQSRIMTRLRAEMPDRFNKGPFVKGNQYNGMPKGSKRSVESKNKTGTCDLQIYTKVFSLAKKLGRTPRMYEVKREYGYAFLGLLRHRYGDYKGMCRGLGLKYETFADHPWARKYTNKSLIEKGVNAVLKEGKPLDLKKIFTKNEYKSAGRHFKSVGELREEILNEIRRLAVVGYNTAQNQ